MRASSLLRHRHASSIPSYSLPPRAPAAPALCAAALASACVLAPDGYDAERERMLRAGDVYAQPAEERALPELPPEPSPSEVIWRAYLANGDLEAAYFDWRAAVERVEAAAGWPNTDFMPSFSVMLEDGEPTTWESTALGLGFDAAENLELPIKARRYGEIALAEARAAGERFRAARLALKRRVLEAWLDLWLSEEEARVARADRELLSFAASAGAPRVQAGGPQLDLIRAGVEARRAEDRVLALEAQGAARRAFLNGLLERPPAAPLGVAAQLPEPRPLPDDQALLSVHGVGASPELAALAEEVEGRAGELELAELAYLPNLNPFAVLSGDATTLGVAAMLPTALPEIRSGIAEARARLQGARAMQRQERHHHDAAFAAALVALRDAERAERFYTEALRPSVELLAGAARRSYSAGASDLDGVIEAQRALLEVRFAAAEARVERERRAAELEELSGTDLQGLEAPAEEAVGDAR